jgi:hypothetical protein
LSEELSPQAVLQLTEDEIVGLVDLIRLELSSK